MCEIERQQLGASVGKSRGVCIAHIPEQVGRLVVATLIREFGAKRAGRAELVVNFYIKLIVPVLVCTGPNPVVQVVIGTRAHVQIRQGIQLDHLKSHGIDDVAGPIRYRVKCGDICIPLTCIGR